MEDEQLGAEDDQVSAMQLCGEPGRLLKHPNDDANPRVQESMVPATQEALAVAHEQVQELQSKLLYMEATMSAQVTAHGRVCQRRRGVSAR